MINLDKLIHPESSIKEIGIYVQIAVMFEFNVAMQDAIKNGNVGIGKNYHPRVNVNKILRNILPKLGDKWNLKLLKQELAIERKRFREAFSEKVADQFYLTLNEIGEKKDFQE